MKERKPQMPNGALYHFVYGIAYLFFKIMYRFKVDRTDAPEITSPFVLLVNHISNLDFLLPMLAMYPHKLNLVATMQMFRMRPLRPFLWWLGFIPKEQFVSDPKSIRHIFYISKQGGNVEIFPSGQSSYTGESTEIDPNIVKLLQKLKLPVYSLRISGMHIALPKWNMSLPRASRVELKVGSLLTVADLAGQSTTELYNRIVKALYFNDYTWQQEKRIRALRPRSAVGLEQLLYMCPKCKQEFTIRSKGNHLSCVQCGNAANMDHYGFLAPEKADDVVFTTPPEWYKWQKNEYRLNVTDGAVYCEPCRIFRITDSNKFVPVGEGRFYLSREVFRYTGTCEGRNLDYSIDNHLNPNFSNEIRGYFNIGIEGQIYAIQPHNSPAVFKVTILKELFSESCMTEA
ncbi:MAG TPA: lysophospholipid acyltransferase family protein [Clostridia bacterium]|nr:lysophospholipid acyltransferase family protein [Clostridia bacterium]